MRKTYLFLVCALMALLGVSPARGALTISTVVYNGTGSSTSNYIYADSDNHVSGIYFTLTLTNDGTEDIPAGSTTIEGINPNKSNYLINSHVVDVDVPAGQSVNFVFPIDFDLTPLWELYGGANYTSDYISCPIYFRTQGDNGMGKYGSYLYVYAYLERFILTQMANTVQYMTDISFGLVREPAEMEVRLRNSGQAPVKVEEVELPEGFILLNELPIEIGNEAAMNSDERSVVLKIKFDPATPGSYSGPFVLKGSTGYELKRTLSGTLVDPEAYLEDFESAVDNQVPGWIINSPIVVTNHSTSDHPNSMVLQSTHNGSYSDSFVDAPLAISPKLHFEEGDELFFQSIAYGTSYPGIKVCWSPDRVNWEVLKTVTYSGKGGDTQWSTTGNYINVTVDSVPAGDGYIGFYMNYCRIDNVMGGKRVDVDCDLYVTSSDMPDKATVNNTYTGTLNVKNLAGKVAETAYTAGLYAAPVPVKPETSEEGEEAETPEPVFVKVLDIPAVDIEENASVVIKAEYIPHDVGEYIYYIALEVGDQKFSGKQQRVTVFPESASGEFRVGNPNGNDNSVPLFINYYNSQTQSVYTEEYLQQFGIQPGSKIVGVQYKAYASSTNAIAGPDSKMSVGMMKWESSTISNGSAYDFTEFQGEQTEYVMDNKSSATNMYNYIDMDFATPFIYEGGNLLICVKSEKQSKYAQVYFEKGADVQGQTIEKHDDVYDRYLTNSWNTKNFLPVVYFKVENDPIFLSGVVTKDEEPIAGAKVSANANGVIYNAVTDENGAYKMQIIQASKDYIVTVEAEGHPRFTSPVAVKMDGADATFDVALLDWPTLSGSVKNSKNNGVAGAEVVLSWNDYTRTIVADEEGKYSAVMDNIDGNPFTVTVDHKDYRIFNGEVSLYDGKDKTYDIVMEDFTRNREYVLTLSIEDMRGTSTEGLPFTLRTNLFDHNYAAEETMFDADGKCVINVYGGPHTLTITGEGMKSIVKEFDVNKDLEFSLVFNEDVNNPEGLNARVLHDVFTGRNDIRLTWNDESNPQPQSVASRSAANPVEKFVIMLDGAEVAQTDLYSYTLENVADGNHTISVYAKYVAQQSEVMSVKVALSASDYVAAKYYVTTNNGESVEGIDVIVADAAGEIKTVVEDGCAVIPSLPKGEYTVSVAAPYFKPWSRTVTYTDKKALYIDLEETLGAPVNLNAIAEENEGEGTFNVSMNWNRDFGFSDSFEDYEDFATGTFGDWRTLNLNTEASYPIMLGNQNVTFPGASTEKNPVSVAPMVFNPQATTPSLAGDRSFTAADGIRSVLFQGPKQAVADKWLISPMVKVNANYEVAFQAKSYDFYPEALEVCISANGNEPSDFTVVETIRPTFDEWNSYHFDLSAYTGMEVYVGIHCVSKDGFAVMVDDFRVGCKGDNVIKIGKVVSYDVMLNDELHGNTAETEYTMADVPAGNHMLGVKANYASGASEVTTVPLTLVSGVDSIEAEGAVGDVVTPAGVVIKRNATMKEVRKLDKGIYIFRGRKVVVK